MNTWEGDNNNPTPMFVGTITADEMVYAGASFEESNTNFYLMNNSFKNRGLHAYNFWSLSPSEFKNHYDNAIDLDEWGDIKSLNVINNFLFRPSVSLKQGTTIKVGGEGTLESPYVVE